MTSNHFRAYWVTSMTSGKKASFLGGTFTRVRQLHATMSSMGYLTRTTAIYGRINIDRFKVFIFYFFVSPPRLWLCLDFTFGSFGWCHKWSITYLPFRSIWSYPSVIGIRIHSFFLFCYCALLCMRSVISVLVRLFATRKFIYNSNSPWARNGLPPPPPMRDKCRPI